MNPKTTLNVKSKIIFTMGLFICLLASACSQSAVAPSPTIVADLPTKVLPTSTSVPTVEPTLEPTTIPVEKQVYPYYLPLVTKLENISQTINGVTVKIDWAYVDESRVAIQYAITGLDWPNGSYLDSSTQIQMSIPVLAAFQYGGFSGALGGVTSPAEQGVITGTSDQALLSGIWDAELYPSVNLGVDIPVAGPTNAGTFHFDFTVPVVSGSKTIENIDQTVVANDVSMTLKSLILSPSHAEALICFQMPSTVDWGLTATTLILNDREYPFSSSGLATGKADPNSALTSPERCSDVGFDVAYDSSSDAVVTLAVPHLQASIPELVTKEIVDRANQRLADQGIQFDYVNGDHSGTIVVLKRPEGASDLEVYPLIWKALPDQYAGPWVFTITVPK